MLIENEILRQKVAAKLDEILVAIPKIAPNRSPLALLSGPVGSTLFYLYMAKMRDSQALYEQGYELILTTYDSLEVEGVNYFSFANGLVGFGLFLNLVAEKGILNADIEETLTQFDALLIEYATQLLVHNNLDYLHGAIGNGFYLLARTGKTAATECLGTLLRHLRDSALEDENGIRWLDAPSKLNNYQAGLVNLSLSHGLVSKVIFLAKCLHNQIEPDLAKPLLQGAVRFLLHQRVDSPSPNKFPSKVASSSDKTFTNRLAWCYGDLGVVIALLHAGKVMEQPEWIAYALDLAEQTTVRTSEAETMMVDAGFCHGTAGVAHIYNRLYFETDRVVFREARDYWIEETLNKSCFADGIAGYKTYTQEKWVADPSLLEGVAGIGLVLQSYLEADCTNLSWDSLFLLDWPV